MKSLLVIGECMLELRERDNSSLHKSFAGDVYNTAVYAKRYNHNLKVGFLTGLGLDKFSQELKQSCLHHSLDTQYCLPHRSANIGIYNISTDDAGERYFTYWRKNSAASDLITLLDQNKGIDITDIDTIYFSGISLAILSDNDKDKLLTYLKLWKSQGCQVAFDPNYRPHLWSNVDHAQLYFNQCYQIADIILPGLDDHQALYNHQNYDDIVKFFEALGKKELVIKAGESGVFGCSANGESFHVPFVAAPKQVDATAAGDSFAGTYLAARLNNVGIQQSIQEAAKVAGVVVQHPGAIIDESIVIQ